MILQSTNDETDHTMLCLQEQGFPLGLAQSVVHHCRESFPQRIWIIDNSGSMITNDGRKLVPTSVKNHVQWERCSRWEELKECITYHAQMAALLNAPTKFIWLNSPFERNLTFSHDIACLGPEWVDDELTSLFQSLQETQPSGVTPLTRHLRNLYAMILPQKEALEREGQRVVLCLATDGIPTDDTGVIAAVGTSARAEFEHALRRLLQDLPVWMVVRLCTSDDNVIQYYESLDGELELSLEVLDDYLDEAKEVHKFNPWLSYGLALHRCRELGFHDPLLDLLDERKLTKDELSRFAQLLLGGSSMLKTSSGTSGSSMTARHSSRTYCDPHLDWEGFLQDLKLDLGRNDVTYHPIRKRLRPWLDLEQLQRIYAPQSWYTEVWMQHSRLLVIIVIALLAILHHHQP